MIVVLNRATQVTIPDARVNKVDNRGHAVMIREKDSRPEQVGAINQASKVSKVSKVNKASRVNKEVSLIVIARDNKVVCPNATVNRDSRKRLHPSVMLHHMMKTWILTARTRIPTAA
jgi:hypothetical protein